ncbi:hypothetical protein [Kineococcus sp. SYSU DK002]|uniref:hypothetical protein n=1 Tax=Kineococcus sp. SYSU DK002 TaxID=3383123 RepID=UPI003D7CA223
MGETVPGIDLVADGEHRYLATLRGSDGTRTEHVVTSDPDLLERVAVTPAEEPFLVRRVVEVLLETAETSGGTVPAVVDLRELDAARPELLRSVPLR